MEMTLTLEKLNIILVRKGKLQLQRTRVRRILLMQK